MNREKSVTSITKKLAEIADNSAPDCYRDCHEAIALINSLETSELNLAKSLQEMTRLFNELANDGNEEYKAKSEYQRAIGEIAKAKEKGIL